MKGSGPENIVIEAGVCVSGSLLCQCQVMSGEHHNRAPRIHKMMLYALERLLFHHGRSYAYTTVDHTVSVKSKSLNSMKFLLLNELG